MRCAHGLTPLIPSLPADSASRPVLQQLGASSAKAACQFEFLFLILTTLHGQATMTAEISTMRLDIGDIQEALKNHDSWMEDVSNTLQQMQEKEENLTEDIINLKNEMNTKLDTKVDNVAWKDSLNASALWHCCEMLGAVPLGVEAFSARKPMTTWMLPSRLSVTWFPRFAWTWTPVAGK